MPGASSLLLLSSGSAPFSPLTLPGLFCHCDVSQKTLVYDAVQERDEVDALPDQSGSGVIGVPITYPDDGLNGAILRPRWLADAGDGKPGIDGRDGTIGRGLRLPFTAEQLAPFHDGATEWTIITNVWIPPGETVDVVAVSTGGYTGSNAGITLWWMYFAGGFKIRLSFSDGTTAVNILDTVVSPPQASHLAVVCKPSEASPLKVYLNGIEADEWTGELPTAAGAGSGFGLCLGNWARGGVGGAYFGSAWLGRHLTICKAALSETQIVQHANWAEGYV